MTENQWEALLAASHGKAEAFHGATRSSLMRKGLVRFVAGAGLRLTIRGLVRLREHFADDQIGPVRAD